MKKIIFISLWGLTMSMNIFAGGKFVSIEYKHSRRIPNNEIMIKLGSENNNDKIFFAIMTAKNKGQQGENGRFEKIISIEREYFYAIYNRAMDIDYNSIIKSYEDRVGIDGINISITVGTRQNNIKTTLRSPDSSTTECEKLYILLFDLFSLFGMEEWL